VSCKARFGLQNIGGAAGLTTIIEGSMDNGVTFEPILATPAAGGAATSALNAVGSSLAEITGYTDVRIRVTAIVSGGPVQARINVTEGV
jgi:hypothetical protein